jgi:hypothetical protein
MQLAAETLRQSVFASVANPDATPVLSAPAVGVVIAVITITAKEGGHESTAAAVVEIATSEVAAVTEVAATPAKMAAAIAAKMAATHMAATPAEMATAHTPTTAATAFGECVLGYRDAAESENRHDGRNLVED